MDIQGVEIVGQLAGMAWLLFFIITLFLGILTVFLPFFVWRIWKWSHATCQEVVKLNAKIDHLAAVMQGGAVASALLTPQAEAQETFTPAPAVEEQPPAEAAAEAPPLPAEEAAAAAAEEKPLELEPFFPEEEEPPPPAPTPEEQPFTFEPLKAAEEEKTTEGEERIAVAPFDEQAPSEEPPAAPAAEEETAPPEPRAASGITRLADDSGKPGTRFARCEGCGHKLAYKQALAGKRVRCPSCKTVHTLP